MERHRISNEFLRGAQKIGLASRIALGPVHRLEKLPKFVGKRLHHLSALQSLPHLIIAGCATRFDPRKRPTWTVIEITDVLIAIEAARIKGAETAKLFITDAAAAAERAATSLKISTQTA